MNKFINMIKDKFIKISKVEKVEEELKNHDSDEHEGEEPELSIPVNLIYNGTVVGTACMNVHLKSKSE